jgi:DUF4097 and DUF4098 domain-containing protein YvlB
MAGYPPPYPPPGFDPRAQRRFLRDQARAQARAQRDAFRAQREQVRYQMRNMGRGSILGPLLLIAAGVVFLLIQTGRIDHSRFWGWYGRWWPLLLVVAGVVVLAEWALDQFVLRDPQRPPYRRSLGGGVVVLVIAFVVAGIIASNVHNFPSGYSKAFPGIHFDQDSMDEFFGDKHESDQTLDLPFAAGSSLEVANPRGDVTVSGISDDDRIHIAIHKQVYARTDSEADSKARQLVPATGSAGSMFNLSIPSIDGCRADLVITVPAGAVTTVTANHGDIHVASIKAAVNATANHGDIELSAITGATSAHLNNSGSSLTAHGIGGGIAIQGRADDLTLTEIAGPVTITGEFFGATHLEHVNGSIHFHTSRTDLQFGRLDGESEISSDGISADQVMGPVVLTSGNRNISLNRVAGSISVTNHNGEIELTAAQPLGAITLEDRNDAVHVTLPRSASFSVDGHTTNGEVSTDFPLSTGGGDNDKTLTGSVGSGGPLLRIHTSNSDISVSKGDVEPLPVTPPAPPKITLAPPSAPKAPHPPSAPKAPKASDAPSATQ